MKVYVLLVFTEECLKESVLRQLKNLEKARLMLLLQQMLQLVALTSKVSIVWYTLTHLKMERRSSIVPEEPLVLEVLATLSV